MKKHLTEIIIAVLLIAGLGILMYPTVSNLINQGMASKAITNYNSLYINTDKDSLRTMMEEAENYNERLTRNFTGFYEESSVQGYEDTLNIAGTGIMGYIDIDKINVELPIYHGVDKGVLQMGVGHIEGSSLPVGGESTHCVLSGHRGLPSAKLFTDLDKLEIGDTFQITVMGNVLTYTVDQIKIVLPDESADLMITKGKDYCTLVTCTPYGINTHRLLVRGVRTDNGEGNKPRVFIPNEAIKIDTVIVAPVIALPILLMVIILVSIKEKYKNKLLEVRRNREREASKKSG